MTESGLATFLLIHTRIGIQRKGSIVMGKTNIVLDEELMRKARKVTGLRTKQEIVAKALELLVRTESRKGILCYYGSGIWKGDIIRMRRNRV